MKSILGIVLIIATVVPASGCATWRKQAVTDAKQCAAAEFEQAIADLLPAVSGILTGGAVNWQTQLEALAEKLGSDFVACAVAKFASIPFSASAVASSAKPAAMAAQMDAAQARARQYLSAKKVAL